MKKYMRLLVALIITVTVAVLFYILYKNRNRVPVEESNPTVNQDECIKAAGSQLVGSWESLPSEDPVELGIELNAENRFVYRVDSDNQNSYKMAGRWEYDRENVGITFTFDDLNDSWQKILTDPQLKETYTGVMNYSLLSKTIKLKIGYMEREAFQDCEVNRYYIDFLGYRIYRKD
ncbi:MAG: hypothetical protein PHS44_04390 [Candidatus Dojkabacteria bacterium]|nr:hypothetical protein [Candidatus Dojkabacteria bacterium]